MSEPDISPAYPEYSAPYSIVECEYLSSILSAEDSLQYWATFQVMKH